MHLDFPLAAGAVVAEPGGLGAPIKFSLELKHRRLLLLSNRYRGRAFKLFNLINLDICLSQGDLDRTPLLREVVFSKVGVVFFLPMPVAFVPD